MSETPYQPNCHYLLSTISREHKESAKYDSRCQVLTIVTKPILGVSYQVVFETAGEAPYGGVVMKCKSITEVTE